MNYPDSIQLQCSDNLTDCIQTRSDGKTMFIMYLIFLLLGAFGTLANWLW